MPDHREQTDPVWEAILRARAAACTELESIGLLREPGQQAEQYAEQHAQQAAGRVLLDVLMPLAVHRGRLAIAQLGQSVDGRIATDNGDSWYINGPAARTHLHRLRALVDAVLIGAGTAEEDRPQLSVRHVSGPDPVPVILDPRGRVQARGPLFERPAGTQPVLHLVGRDADPAPLPGVERLHVPLGPDGVSPQKVLDMLAERGLKRVLIEGGGITVSRFLAADVLDYLHLLIAPLMIGSGRPGIRLNPIERLAEARRPPMRSFPLGDELLLELRLGSIRHGGSQGQSDSSGQAGDQNDQAEAD